MRKKGHAGDHVPHAQRSYRLRVTPAARECSTDQASQPCAGVSRHSAHTHTHQPTQDDVRRDVISLNVQQPGHTTLLRRLTSAPWRIST